MGKSNTRFNGRNRMARTDAEKVQYAIDLIRQAQEAGVVPAHEAERHLRELGVEEPAAAVTVIAQVRGDVDQLRNGGGGVTRQIEQALAGLGRQVGLTVVAGSVRVVVGEGAPTAPVAAPAAGRPQAAGARAVTISLGWNGDRLNGEARQIVEDRLATLGREFGVTVVPGSVTIAQPGGGTTVIELRATGVEQLTRQAPQAGRAIEQALAGLAAQYGLARPDAGSVRLVV